MKSYFDRKGAPSPELLAAYLDGEFEGRDESAALRGRIESWLENHPAGQAELAELRRLGRLFRTVMPSEPSESAWNLSFERIRTLAESAPAEITAPRPRMPVRRVGAIAAALLVCCLLPWSGVPVSEPDAVRNIEPALAETAEEPLMMAGEDDVEILRVDGGDFDSLVVGRLAMLAPMELVGPGEASLTSVPLEMEPTVSMRTQGIAMIWAKNGTDQ